MSLRTRSSNTAGVRSGSKSDGVIPINSSRVYPRLSHAWRFTSSDDKPVVEQEKGVGGMVHERPEPLLALPQRRLGMQALEHRGRLVGAHGEE